MHVWLAGAALGFIAGPAVAGNARCGLPEGIGMRELHRILSLRAVELVSRAATSVDTLMPLIDPSATFSLGAGDVGRPLGEGVSGARKLAEVMHADTYRFLGWDYMDSPTDACAPQKVEVEFIDSDARSVSSVEFSFEAGRVVDAAGWKRSFEVGPLAKVPVL